MGLLTAACVQEGEVDELQALLRDDGEGTGSLALPVRAQSGPDGGPIDDGGVPAPDGGVAPDDGGQGPVPDGGTVPPTQPLPFGRWSFNDCNPFETELQDSTFRGNSAFRAVAVDCAEGVSGQAVALDEKEDIVYVPDEPDFTFASGLTVAGWFKPTVIGKTRTLIRKRDNGTSSFALVLNDGKFQIVINLGEGRAASVTAPKKAKAGVFQHVAATYDGTTLRLFIDGAEVGTFVVPGEIPPGPGPLLIGNDKSERRFEGVIDDVVFEGRALTEGEVQALLCIPQDPVLSLTPSLSAPTAPGASATFEVTVTNLNSRFCPATTYFLNVGAPFDVDVVPTFDVSPPVAPGQQAYFSVTATPSDLAEPGVRTLPFFVQSFDPFGFAFGTADLVIAEPTGCHVSTPRELMITDLSVVDDPVRAGPFATGAWSFKHLVESMAPTPEDAPAMVEQMLATFTTDQDLNGFFVGARPGMQAILATWPRTDAGQLDLAQAPFTLLAIVNRFDLRSLAEGNAGEGRFVFGFTAPGSFFPLQATLIFEYKLPAATDEDVLAWAHAFHGLGSLPFSEDYNQALQELTERFAGRGARPGAPNGSAINAVRTNEIDLGDNGRWELREFAFSPETGMLVPNPVERTPDLGFNGTFALASFINENQASIVAETHAVPRERDGAPFGGGAIFNDLSTWFAPDVDPEARHHFAINTCNGCHSAVETNTSFLHISPRFPGNPTQLSPFLIGTTVFDPVTGEPRTLRELARRAADLKAVVCQVAAKPGLPANLREGSRRVH